MRVSEVGGVEDRPTKEEGGKYLERWRTSYKLKQVLRCLISEVVDAGLVVSLDLENLSVVEVRVGELCVDSNTI